MRSQNSAEEAKRRTLEKADKFNQLFSTPNGREVLAALEAEFEPVNLFDDNPHRTSYNAGRRDVIQYIKQMMRASDAHNETTI